MKRKLRETFPIQISLILIFVFILNYTSEAQNYALDFNGINQYGQVSHNDALKPNQFTIEAWVRADVSNNTYKAIVSTGASYNNGVNAYGAILYNYNNRWVLAYGNQGAFQYLTSNTPVQVGVWTHVAATYNGSEFRLYVNGNLDRTTNHGYSPDKPNGNALYIGADYTTGGDYFDGLIDYVRIWNAALTDQQIRNNISRSIPPNENNLVANYEFNEGSGSSFSNSSTNVSGLNGTLVNGPTWESVPRKTLHLKTDVGLANSGNNLTGWQDQAGVNNFTVIGTPGYVANGINFHPTVSFNNTDAPSTLPSSRLEGNTSIQVQSAIVVMKSNSNTSTLLGSTVPGPIYGPGLFGYRGNENQLIGRGDDIFKGFFNLDRNDFSIALIDFSGLPGKFFLNNGNEGVFSFTTNFRDITVTPMVGGTNNNGNASGWNPFNGEVAEIVTYPTPLLNDPSNVRRLMTYMAIKYGITLNKNTQTLTHYEASNGTILWDDENYWNDVFGIGRDDASGLNQSQSNSINTGSGDGTGQSGKGNIVISDPSTLADGDFLMIGHDNGALTEQSNEVPASLAGSQRIGREWKVNHTNDVGTIDLTFNTLGLTFSGTQASDFKLLIDTDGNGNFEDGTVTVLDANSYSGNVITFDAVILPQGAVFTFITKTSGGPGPGVPGAALWLKADAGTTSSSGTLTSWLDQTGNFTSSIESNPQIRTQKVNFQPSVAFDGTNDGVTIPYSPVLNSPTFTINIVVLRPNNLSGGKVIDTYDNSTTGAGYSLDNAFDGGQLKWNFGLKNGSGYTQIRGGNTSINQWDLLTVKYDGANVNFYKDGQLAGTAPVGSYIQNTVKPFHIAYGLNSSTPSFFFRGEIAELSYHSSGLSDADLAKIQSYLAIKYGISLGDNTSAVAYTSAAGTTFWPANATYKYDILK
ncbi:LamG domain-containing protein [Siansivirga zeaxanthinifaciens]|uniref:LamG-like jellyroll fold domain-containing protein n=1 Tax=Siansivirga zeaxanthinifaciens CC-SAMT-1 TaxID=1454006 RepID=A0A0C5W0E4_9FLAO|nr:LamG domain-containing protein [Siansivirga zeaxanthinifaciens]AJR04731.1 hypothetical protein AW14_02495 [Siansivirga zeaxanthinifaciens CC-SAMT-1]